MAGPVKPESEREITTKFVEIASPRFELWPQVTIKHPWAVCCKRIDFIGRELAGNYRGWIGFELKRGEYDHFSNFTDAMKQAIDYSHGVIQSDLKEFAPRNDTPEFFNQRLRHTFVFPCPFAVHKDDDNSKPYDAWAQGVIRMCGKFGVGAMIKSRRAYHPGYELILGAETMYEFATGVTKAAGKIHQGNSRFGCQG